LIREAQTTIVADEQSAVAKVQTQRQTFWRARPWLWLALAALVGGAAAYVYSSHSRSMSRAASNAVLPPRPVLVHVAQARIGGTGVYLTALGTVTPVSTVNISSQVTGQVVAVHYREGQMVHTGDALIDIDPRPYQAQLQQVQGVLDRDRGMLRQAQIDLARYQQAYAQHAVAKQTLDDQEQAVAQDEGSVKNDMGQVAFAEVQLSYCHIRSPISGRVGLRLVDQGNTVFVGASTPLVVLTQLQPITVVFNIAEDHLAEVQRELRQQGQLRVDALDRSAQGELERGAVRVVDNQIDTATGTLRLRGEFRNANLGLFPNQFVNVRVLLRTLSRVVLVPTGAVQRNGTDAFIYMVDGHQVTVRHVTELAVDSDTAAVAGIPSGALVATSSFDKLEQGTPVTVERQASGEVVGEQP
jgi:multidrug efflux system membrane fusion protein